MSYNTRATSITPSKLLPANYVRSPQVGLQVMSPSATPLLVTQLTLTGIGRPVVLAINPFNSVVNPMGFSVGANNGTFILYFYKNGTAISAYQFSAGTPASTVPPAFLDVDGGVGATTYALYIKPQITQAITGYYYLVAYEL